MPFDISQPSVPTLPKGDPAAAARVRQKIEAAAGRLGPFPRIGRRGSAPGTREWKVTGLPYVIVHEFQLEAGEVVILGVFHEAQLRPGQTAIPEEN
jgi:toxin ParE1/3/4